MNKSKNSLLRLSGKSSNPQKMGFKYSDNSIADMKNYYERRINSIKAQSKNKQIALQFLKEKESQGLSDKRIYKLTTSMIKLLSLFEKDFDKINLEDVRDVVLKIRRNQKYKDWTIATEITILKSFIKWINKKYDLKIDLEEIKVNRPRDIVLPEYLISSEEFNRLINAITDSQTKLIVNLLFESACRVSEVLNLKIQSVSFNEYGSKIRVVGKGKRERLIPIVWNSNSLREFIESHPNKDNPESNLWYFEQSGIIKPLSYQVLRMRLKRTCKKIGFKKRIWFHLMRHTRLTELSKEVSEQILKAIAGFSKDSDMTKTYVNLSQKDIEENLLSKVYGIKTNGNNGEKLKICSKCGETNPYFNKICSRCKTDLDERKLQEKLMTEEQMKQVNDFSQVFMEFLKIMEKKDPTVWDSMKEAMKKKGIELG